jgi:hypothetical protein
MHIYNVSRGGRAIPISIRNAQIKDTEKNWTPFVHESRLYFIYSFVPLVVLTLPNVENGECVVTYAERCIPNSRLRGGTPAIEIAKGVYKGFLHVICPLSASSKSNDPNELPLPARLTSNFYRTQSFTLTMTEQNIPSLTLGPEISFFDKQIELVYGWNGKDQIVLNINDRQTVFLNVDHLNV